MKEAYVSRIQARRSTKKEQQIVFLGRARRRGALSTSNTKIATKINSFNCIFFKSIDDLPNQLYRGHDAKKNYMLY